MKTIMSKLFLLTAFLLLSFGLMAQPPHPPSQHSQTGNQAPAGAPVGNGTLILLTLAAAYGGWKLYPRRSTELAE